MFNQATTTSSLLAISTASAADVECTTMANSYTSPITSNGTYTIQTIAKCGDLSLSGMFRKSPSSGRPTLIRYKTTILMSRFLAANHFASGTGSTWLPVSFMNSANSPLLFNAATGDIYFVTDTSLWSLTYSTGANYGVYPGSWPSGYSLMGMNEGTYSSGFSFNATTNEVLPSSYSGKGLAVCPAKSYAGGIVYVLMWRLSGALKNASCAEVVLKAIPGQILDTQVMAMVVRS